MLERHNHLSSQPDGPSRRGVAHGLLDPEHVLRHPDMTIAEKREVLAAWASDAHAVPDAPGLRQIDSGAVIGVDVILDALRELDAIRPTVDSRSMPDTHGRRPVRSIRTLLRRDRHSDDDDDPPPSPAGALPFGVECVRRRKWGTAPEPLAA